MNDTYNKYFMELAVNEAREGIRNKDGGPFGAVVVRNGEVVASGHNHVLSNNDSTCHGEIDAIRKAEQKLGTFDLSGCEIYTTGEPCPMCLAAVLWANIERVYFGCRKEDEARIGFRDMKFSEILGISEGSKLPKGFLEERDREICLEVFREYENMGETNY